ncbi:esterase-like activity of phytase family protein [Saccharopolyspora sp. ASAGF58]|uniref:esterase-like activity of phytase family protein n=1 Tax=Saccharopolyspora sp. ASAGF58 TaxID=2719023 RepID=UPI001440268D|nr:esterase-like activity of phytase family protein [Saccharopolyspora sp. ASAGF58]QIZ38369.1 esterase-like activity of phytase family protein [Saccharopolyspora sp. ASAGF58]
MQIRTRSAVLAAAALLFLAPAAFPAAAQESASSRLLGTYVVPHDLRVDGTPVGGLSSVDYDRRSGDFIFVSDDWSDHAPARYYRADVSVTERGVEDVTFTGASLFRRPDGTTYPAIDIWRGAVQKKLLVDLDEIGVPYTDNVEGISWGPLLPTGERVLLVVSDNNFSPNQQTQLIAIAVR